MVLVVDSPLCFDVVLGIVELRAVNAAKTGWLGFVASVRVTRGGAGIGPRR